MKKLLLVCAPGDSRLGTALPTLLQHLLEQERQDPVLVSLNEEFEEADHFWDLADAPTGSDLVRFLDQGAVTLLFVTPSEIEALIGYIEAFEVFDLLEELDTHLTVLHITSGDLHENDQFLDLTQFISSNADYIHALPHESEEEAVFSEPFDRTMDFLDSREIQMPRTREMDLALESCQVRLASALKFPPALPPFVKNLLGQWVSEASQAFEFCRDRILPEEDPSVRLSHRYFSRRGERRAAVHAA
ncbi:MAG: hypothetical protein AAF555_00715 [Verrucomicrobiota bacterium]